MLITTDKAKARNKGLGLAKMKRGNIETRTCVRGGVEWGCGWGLGVGGVWVCIY